MASQTEVRLTVGGERVTARDVTRGEAIDLKNRDPESLHDNMRIHFHDVFGEPDESVYSFDCVWTCAFRLFTNVKLWTYRIVSLLCGLPLAIYWGVYFAILSFCVIWCCEPYLKAFAIELGCVRRIFNTLLAAFYRPCAETIGYIFYNIRITRQ
ncbi:hypothetical protein DPMN_016352 [Dreissena polymorpha]|uniref:Caveolin n=1 Tax=Dreissena polymorpha TaxID=45954 RepID=A0A9D4ND07_DREPO|nr:hypothetical protein DPMN_016352 [Dreissena polymorpha]